MRESQTKLKALNDALVKLSSRLEQTEGENKQLEEEVKRLHRGHPQMDSLAHNEQGLRGSIADKYADYKRSEMLSAVVDLELVRTRETKMAPHSSSLGTRLYFQLAHWE